jgi:hypothetical protein
MTLFNLFKYLASNQSDSEEHFEEIEMEVFREEPCLERATEGKFQSHIT